MIIAWWSAGVTSAIATKLALDMYGKGNVMPIYFQIDSAHPDNLRFKQECEEWYGKDIVVERAPEKYKDQFDVILKDKYVNGPAGARCTLILKKRVRQKLEKNIIETVKNIKARKKLTGLFVSRNNTPQPNLCFLLLRNV